MFPEFKKYSILPESKGTTTSSNTIQLVDENNYPLFEGIINLAKEKQNKQLMKTAMQELIDEIQYYKEKESLGSTSRDWLILIETIATNKLEKEKEQIMDAFDEGEDDWTSDGEQYYNEKYKNN